jgi:hypothetical protein
MSIELGCLFHNECAYICLCRFVYHSVIFEYLPNRYGGGGEGCLRGCLIKCYCSVKTDCSCIVVIVDNKTNDRVFLCMLWLSMSICS